MSNKLILSGFWTSIIGLIMLVLEYSFLPLYGWIHKSVVNGDGFYSDAIKYADVQPMPIIFALTAVIIALGVCLAAAGCIGKYAAA